MIYTLFAKLSTELAKFELSNLHTLCCWVLLVYHLTFKRSQYQFWDKIALFASRLSLLIPVTVFTLNHIEATSSLLFPVTFFVVSAYFIFKYNNIWTLFLASGLALLYHRDKKAFDSNLVNSLVTAMEDLLSQCRFFKIDDHAVGFLQKSLSSVEALKESLYSSLTDLRALANRENVPYKQLIASIDSSLEVHETDAMKNLVDFYTQISKIDEYKVEDLLLSTGKVSLKLLQFRVSHAGFKNASIGLMNMQSLGTAGLKSLPDKTLLDYFTK